MRFIDIQLASVLVVGTTQDRFLFLGRRCPLPLFFGLRLAYGLMIHSSQSLSQSNPTFLSNSYARLDIPEDIRGESITIF
jgi:hypothetical protein